MSAITQEAAEKGKRLSKNEKKRLKEKLRKNSNNNRNNEGKTGTIDSIAMIIHSLTHLFDSNNYYGIQW